MPAHQERLQRVLQCTQAMHTAALAGDWEGVVRREAERRALIAQAFAPDGVIEEAWAERLLTQILTLDRQVLALAGQARAATADALSQLNHGRRVVHAYRAVES